MGSLYCYHPGLIATLQTSYVFTLDFYCKYECLFTVLRQNELFSLSSILDVFGDCKKNLNKIYIQLIFTESLHLC